MNDLKRISIVAVALLVLLRIAIGWQFVYEGLWKYSTLESPSPWTAEGYLKSSQGPLRDYYRGLTGDPDDLNWLDYETMSKKWDAWQAAFIAHYGLDDAQQRQLARLMDGAPQYVAELKAVPEAARKVLENKSGVIKFDAQHGRLIVQGNTPLEPGEAAALKASVHVVRVPGSFNDLSPVYARASETGDPLRDQDGKVVPADLLDAQFYQAIEKLERDSARLGYRQRLQALLEGDPDRVGVVGQLNNRNEVQLRMGTVTPADETPQVVNVNFGKIQQYRDELAAYDAALAKAEQSHLAYEWEHVQKLGAKLASLRSELVGPIRALEADMKETARRQILTPAQIALGLIPPDFHDRLTQASWAALAGLLILGVLLILGLCTRVSALLGAVMLIGFYLVLPPWPGVPQPPSPEHSFIVNKNLIEAVALLGIAAMPTGSWFGLDGLIRWLFRRGKSAGAGESREKGGSRVRRA